MRQIGLGLVVLLLAAAPAAAQVAPYGENDGGGFHSVLPPGQNGLDNGVESLSFAATGARPANNTDQLGMYGDLVYATPGLRAADLDKYFKDGTFGVKPENVVRTYSPRPDVTIVRDEFGVPHVYGQTRDAVMFGSGYVQAEDRLFFIDVLRHVGRGEGAQFIGGSSLQFDRDVWRASPYTEAELKREYDLFDDRFGPEAARVQQDIAEYDAGINQYIGEARMDPSKMPAEYDAINRPEGPDPFVPQDAVVAGIVFGAILGGGGGGELDSALVLESARKRFGNRAGTRVWRDFRGQEDPEAPTTVRGTRFPYQTNPRRVAPGSLALPDPGSVKRIESVQESAPAARPNALLPRLDRHGMSNAMLISGRETESGHPVVVMGPQTGYFGPQPLIEVDLHGGGIDARGAAVVGTPYVALGRGRDYAWSATSSGQDLTDTFAVPLCEQDGSKPTLDSASYRYRGKCKPIEVVDKSISWSPNLVDQTPAGSATLHAERTDLGIAIARAKIKGKPVLYTSLRSTYGHEVDRPALAVSRWNQPAKIRGPRDFQKATLGLTYAFNWFYVDRDHIAYMQGGANPVRAKNVDPNLPTDSRFEWRKWDPVRRTAKETPFSAHPQTIDQRYITSWNNKPAPGYSAADNQWSYGPVYRSQLFDDRVEQRIRGPRKINLLEAIDAMEDAGTVDLRGAKVLPWMLKALGRPRDATLRAAAATLAGWVKSGAHRRDKDRDGVYEDSNAVRIMDAWWPLWVKAQFEPSLGADLYAGVTGMAENGIDDHPNGHGLHHGSAWQGAMYGQAQKDLRTLLGESVRGRYSRVYCGGSRTRAGSLGRCRKLLARTLAKAVATPNDAVYGADPICDGQPPVGPADPGRKSHDQWCWDAVWHQQAAVVSQPLIHWINRPTWQQAIAVERKAPR
jgi:acyl-homoserine lactone acylase PvdQ